MHAKWIYGAEDRGVKEIKVRNERVTGERRNRNVTKGMGRRELGERNIDRTIREHGSQKAQNCKEKFK